MRNHENMNNPDTISLEMKTHENRQGPKVILSSHSEAVVQPSLSLSETENQQVSCSQDLNNEFCEQKKSKNYSANIDLTYPYSLNESLTGYNAPPITILDINTTSSIKQ